MNKFPSCHISTISIPRVTKDICLDLFIKLNTSCFLATMAIVTDNYKRIFRVIFAFYANFAPPQYHVIKNHLSPQILHRPVPLSNPHKVNRGGIKLVCSLPEGTQVKS